MREERGFLSSEGEDLVSGSAISHPQLSPLYLQVDPQVLTTAAQADPDFAVAVGGVEAVAVKLSPPGSVPRGAFVFAM